MTDVIDQILEDLNVVSSTDDADLLAFAQELADGVSGDREAEIAEALPTPYTIVESATAQLTGDDVHVVRVPRMAIVMATKVGDDDWVTSAQGRKMRRAKADVAVGVKTLIDNSWVTCYKIIVLWRRDK